MDRDFNKIDGCCAGLMLGYAVAVLVLIANCHGGYSNEEIDRLVEIADRVECIRTTDQHVDSVLRADSVYSRLMLLRQNE